MNAHQAEAIARMVHRNHLYGDRPYIEAHVLPVVQRVIAQGAGEDAIVVAWLHDVLEDSTLTAQDQPMLLLTRAQAVALAAITCGVGEEYTRYIQRVVRDPVARLVKYCDLLQNLSQQPPVNLRRRYLAALDLVRDHLKENHGVPRLSLQRQAGAAAADIEEFFRRPQMWPLASSVHALDRSIRVLDWCAANDWPLATEVTVERLAAAMDRMPYWQQGPSHFFDMARALSAAFLV